MLEGRGIGCVKGEIKLFADINFRLNSSEVLQVVAPNGFGKTSFLKILCNLSRNFNGEIFWNGKPIGLQLLVYLENIIFLGHKLNLQLSLSPIENLRFLLTINDCKNSLEEIIYAFDKFGLRRYLYIKCGLLSMGQCQRVALTRLILQPASIWILDEPCSSLDRDGIELVKNIILKHLDLGGSVILATHQDFLVGVDNVNILRLDKEYV